MHHLLAGTAIAAAVVAAAPAHAQMPDGSVNRAAIEKLAFMVGRWRGDAWMMRGAGERVQVTMTETVEPKVGGVVLQVEGVGVVPGADGAEPRVVHHALGVVSFDPQTGGYMLRSYIASGQSGDFTLTPVEGGVRWSRDVPGGLIRNTALYADGEWHEVGEFSRDGTTWTQIMEMRLRRDP
jgi:hypothetical protein